MANTANSAAFIRVINLRHNLVNLVWGYRSICDKVSSG